MISWILSWIRNLQEKFQNLTYPFFYTLLYTYKIMTPRKKYSCKFSGCGNSYYVKVDRNINKHFYKFPKNHDLCMKWKMICGVGISINCQNMRVCEDHFQPVDFVNFTKHLLNPNVVPKKIEKSNNLIPVQISPPLSTDKTDRNYCRPVSCA